MEGKERRPLKRNGVYMGNFLPLVPSWHTRLDFSTTHNLTQLIKRPAPNRNTELRKCVRYSRLMGSCHLLFNKTPFFFVSQEIKRPAFDLACWTVWAGSGFGECSILVFTISQYLGASTCLSDPTLIARFLIIIALHEVLTIRLSKTRNVAPLPNWLWCTCPREQGMRSSEVTYALCWHWSMTLLLYTTGMIHPWLNHWIMRRKLWLWGGLCSKRKLFWAIKRVSLVTRIPNWPTSIPNTQHYKPTSYLI